MKNNRGINDGQDLNVDILEGIYDEILVNEIKMKDEQAPVTNKKGIFDLMNSSEWFI